jgi:excinuclease ABC subunit C
MIDTAETVEWIVADSEVAALMLEYSLIKQHRPRFNVRLVDDKSYPYLAITRGDEWPRARVMRGAKRKPTEYFGPYAHAYAIRSTLDQLLRTFPIRTCSDGVFRRQQAQGRPCLLFHIEKCVGPCIGAVEPDQYTELVDGLAAFLRGDTEGIVEDLEERMWDAAGREDFELAARFRDRLEDVRRAIERQEVVTDRREDFDLLAVHGDELETSLQVLHVRRGRVVGRLGAMIDRVEELTDPELTESVIRDLYIDEVPPPLIVVAEEPADLEAMRVWLAERRGSTVEVRVPQRGAKRRLLENAQVNAREAFGRHRLKRQSDHNARARALRNLQEILELPEAPLRIEAFDISTLQGTNTVASMVVMEDGLPRRSEYRRFKIRTVEGQDDFASMEEVISRRFQNYLREMNKPLDEQTRFRYPPTLIVIDGGPAQLGRATKAMADAGVSIPAIGLAKRLEEVYVPGQAEPIRIRRDAEALYLLQQIRDEAHRFAITYHRSIRSKSMLDSVLDEVSGIGPTRKKALLKRFGSLTRLRNASEDEMAAVIPAAVASQLYAALHGGDDGSRQ